MELLLDHRLCWLRGGYGVCVTMHHFPLAVFGPKEGRNPQSERRDVLPASDLGLPLFQLHDAGELVPNPLDNVLEADLAIPEVLYGALQPRNYLLTPTRERKE